MIIPASVGLLLGNAILLGLGFAVGYIFGRESGRKSGIKDVRETLAVLYSGDQKPIFPRRGR